MSDCEHADRSIDGPATARCGRSVLVLEPAFGSAARESCSEHLTDADRPVDALSIVYRESIGDRIDLLEGHSESIASAAIVCVGPTGEDCARAAERNAVRTVPDPADLTGVGMAVSEWLTDASERPQRVCLDSLSTLLQYADDERAFRFLHTLTGRFRRAGVGAHVHLDPDAHDEVTVNRFKQLFDDVREPEAGRALATAGTARRTVATDGGRRSTEDS